MCFSFWGSFSELRVTNDLAIKNIHKLSGKMAPLVTYLPHESEDLSSMQCIDHKQKSQEQWRVARHPSPGEAGGSLGLVGRMA